MSDSRVPPVNKVRFVTAASLFDGHDAAINIMRRILQAQGAEVIHLGHNRSVAEVVDAAVSEDAQGIGLSSYQGGHVEYFKYMVERLALAGRSDIKIFGGGGGVIVPAEIEDLHAAGVARIFSPDDGRALGLEGMIGQMIAACDWNPGSEGSEALAALRTHVAGEAPLSMAALGRLLTLVESDGPQRQEVLDCLPEQVDPVVPVIGFTGTGGSGKSSLVDEICRRFMTGFPERRVAVISVDPSRRRTGGALLGDRIRMNSLSLVAGETAPAVFMRSQATRQAHRATSQGLQAAIRLLQHSGFDLVLVETAGIGQSDSAIVDLVDLPVYVMTPEYGAASQLEKIDMLDFADLVVLNKFEKRGALDALGAIKKQVQRNRQRFDVDPAEMPVYPCIASQFADRGVDAFFQALMQRVHGQFGLQWLEMDGPSRQIVPERHALLPGDRGRYLAEIAKTVRGYREWAEAQSELAGSIQHLEEAVRLAPESADLLAPALATRREQLDPEVHAALADWPEVQSRYEGDELVSEIRGRELRQVLRRDTLSGTSIPRVVLPDLESHRELGRFLLKENLPGRFPFTHGVFELKREGEDPTRMFAGEGTPERTNRRFHYVSSGVPAARLSTAFDSVTLYGEDPDHRPDIYGKIGNSGVSVCTLDDAKKLYSGFDLCSPSTSVSMTINGPAPMVLAFFFNAAIDQQVERYLEETGGLEEAKASIAAAWAAKGLPVPTYRGEDQPEGSRRLGLELLGGDSRALVGDEVYERIRAETLTKVRGTVQADILKEDQAQNTCIFSTEFALRVMGDMQAAFVDWKVRNFYSVSISGYHIAEAGANPISQLAFTLANGFTFVEYYKARGMAVDDFAPNLSFFFSNGVDAEYAVIGRVARRIWATAMKRLYGAGERSQKLKYHIQTSGRSLHAQEIDFNDIRTTLQALYAINDNCNSLHTNAFDEAITTPTEASVRRALAIQLIINRELGLSKNENPTEGSYFLEWLTDVVEEAVLQEFERLDERGGVLGAMETMYQRAKIQEESLYYEHRKMTGELPIIGVNTFLAEDPEAAGTPAEVELIRSTEAEKQQQIENQQAWTQYHDADAAVALERLERCAAQGENVFVELMETARVASLGQMSRSLYRVGGSYRRSM